MLWLKYGAFLGDSALIIVNGVGALVSLVTLLIYYCYTNDRPAVERTALYTLANIAALFLVVRLGWIAPQWVGLVAMLASITMFAAPLIAIKNIIRKKDSSVLSLTSILMTLAAALAWTVYGFTKKDAFIVVPNAIGGIMGSLQMLLYCKYRSSERALFKDRSSYDSIGPFP